MSTPTDISPEKPWPVRLIMGVVRIAARALAILNFYLSSLILVAVLATSPSFVEATGSGSQLVKKGAFILFAIAILLIGVWLWRFGRRRSQASNAASPGPAIFSRTLMAFLLVMGVPWMLSWISQNGAVVVIDAAGVVDRRIRRNPVPWSQITRVEVRPVWSRVAIEISTRDLLPMDGGLQRFLVPVRLLGPRRSMRIFVDTLATTLDEVLEAMSRHLPPSLPIIRPSQGAEPMSK